MTMQMPADAANLPGGEFQRYTGDCVWYAVAAAEHVALGLPMTADRLNELVAANVGDPGEGAEGEATLAAAAQQLAQDGAATQVFPYAEPFPTDWHDELVPRIGYGYVALLQLADGGALEAQDAGVHYHMVCVVGHDPDAQLYALCDGDSVEAIQHGAIAVRSLAQLTAADPCGLILVRITHETPAPTPPPAPGTVGVYVVQPGETLSAIAARLGLASWYEGLYKPNMAEIEAAAHAHGQPGSHGGDLIYPGESLRYQA